MIRKALAGGWIGAAQVSKDTSEAFFDGTRSNLNENDTCDLAPPRMAVSLTAAR